MTPIQEQLLIAHGDLMKFSLSVFGGLKPLEGVEEYNTSCFFISDNSEFIYIVSNSLYEIIEIFYEHRMNNFIVERLSVYEAQMKFKLSNHWSQAKNELLKLLQAEVWAHEKMLVKLLDQSRNNGYDVEGITKAKWIHALNDARQKDRLAKLICVLKFEQLNSKKLSSFVFKKNLAFYSKDKRVSPANISIQKLSLHSNGFEIFKPVNQDEIFAALLLQRKIQLLQRLVGSYEAPPASDSATGLTYQAIALICAINGEAVPNTVVAKEKLSKYNTGRKNADELLKHYRIFTNSKTGIDLHDSPILKDCDNPNARQFRITALKDSLPFLHVDKKSMALTFIELLEKKNFKK